MSQLKSITSAGVPAALKKAERYRFLNDAWAAESICRDVLEADPENQEALVMLLLSITDQFPQLRADGVTHARAVLPRIRDDYKRAYYAGIICERRAGALMRQHAPGAGEVAYQWLREAMDFYATAESLRPAGNDESILRWNTCVRMMEQNPTVHPPAAREYVPDLEE